MQAVYLLLEWTRITKERRIAPGWPVVLFEQIVFGKGESYKIESGPQKSSIAHGLKAPEK